MRWTRVPIVLLLGLLLGAQVGLLIACASPVDPPSSPPPEGDLHVLFIGNSLTGANDLPGLVQVIAEETGESLAVRSVVSANYSLEDHWSRGPALEVVREGWADVVVLQQGPSSLPRNQLHLRRWAARFAEEIREAGGRAALYMVWPSSRRMEAFDEVRKSYAGAADTARALFIPAGEAWRAAWRRSPDLALYGGDGFHPNSLGSVMAALTVYRVLYRRSVTELPDTLTPASPGLSTIRFEPELSEIVYSAVEEAVAEFGRDRSDSAQP